MIETLSGLSLFGLSIEELNRVIKVALSRGGTYADLYFEQTLSNELSLKDGEVNRGGSHLDWGVGVRVLAGDKSGYAYSEVITLKEMIKAAEAASYIAQSGSPLSQPKSIKVDYLPPKGRGYYPIDIGWDEVSLTSKKVYLEQLNHLLFSADERVDKVTAQLLDSTSDILFYNSLGRLTNDKRALFSITASTVMESEGRRENNSLSRSFTGGFELLTESLIEEMAKELIESTALLFKAVRPKGGEMPVVMGSGSSGILLHEAIGHSFEADFNRLNISIFSGKIGEKICSEEITVVDDGTIPFNRGALNVDDEGVEGQKTYMVKEGILTSYLHDRISAQYYNLEPTGNGRRESFRYSPLPRMRATYMESGKNSEEEIIASVKRGVFAHSFSNGQVQIGVGNFTFYLKSGYLIENGKLTQPIKDVNIIGNGPQALAGIVGVASNGRIDNSAWMCGKGQYCEVSCGMPSLLVDKLTVGGDG